MPDNSLADISFDYLDDDDDSRDVLAPDEEAVFARDPLGRLVRVDAPTQADLNKKVRIRVDGSEWFEVPKAVPATDAQGNIRYNPDGTTVVRPTTIYDAARVLQPPVGPDADLGPLGLSSTSSVSMPDLSLFMNEKSLSELIVQMPPPPSGRVRIPVLCHQDHVNPVAVCRVCTVQIVSADPRDPTKRREQRKLLPACQHRVEDGMEVHTMWSPEMRFRKAVRTSVQVLYELLSGDHLHPNQDERLRHREQKYRNELAELGKVLADNWSAFTGDASSPRELADRARSWNEGYPRFPERPARKELLVGWVDDLSDTERIITAPPFVVDHNSCIVCDRCSRACSEVKPFRVIGRSGKGPTTRIAFDLRSLPMAESSCRACGECMTACPTGAISFQYRVADASPHRLAEVLGESGTVIEADELLTMPLFSRMSKAFLEWNRGGVRRRTLRPGEVIAVEGEYGTTAFILEDGHLAVCRKGATAPANLRRADEPLVARGLQWIPKKLGPAFWVQDPDPEDVIGEMAPMSHARRNASLVAVTESRVMEIDRNVLFVMLRDPTNRDRLDRRYAQRALREFLPKLATGPGLFGALTRAEVDRVIEAVGPSVKLVRATPGYLICREGEPADAFYLLRLGFVAVTSSSGGPTRPPLRQGNCFGEVALLTRRIAKNDRDFPANLPRGVRSATCTSLDHAELVFVPAEAFEAFLDRADSVEIAEKLRRRAAELFRGAAR